MKKRILSILLTLALTLSLLPASALAAEQSFGISMGGTQLEAGKYYRTNGSATEETTAENYEIYFIEDDTNVYTLTIKDAGEHEITFGSGTTLTVVDYTTAPGGNRATHVARDGGAVMIQSRDGDVTGEPENASSLPTFIVMTSGTTDTTLAPGHTLTLAYTDDDGGYTNACPIQAAETNTADVALLLCGDRGRSNAVALGNGAAMTMAGILYEFTPDVNNTSLTMDFHMNLDSPTSAYSHISGSLKISAPDDYTGIFNGYDFAEGCTEAEFRISKGEDNRLVSNLVRGSIALDKGESVTVNGVPVEGAGSTVVTMDEASCSTVVTMDEASGIATVDGSAIIGGTLETRGNPGDDDYRALVEIDEHYTVTLQEGDAESLETTYFSLANGGTVTVPAETSIAYSSLGHYLELIEGIITADGVEDTVITSYTDYSGEMMTTGNIEFSTQDADSFTLENNWDSVTLSYLSGDMHIAMDEGTELHYSASNAAKVIKAQSRIDNLTIREDGSIWAGETTVQPDADGTYVVGAEHETVTLGGFTVYGNPDGVSYDEETGILTVETRGSYEISNANPGTTNDTIKVSAPGSIVTLKNVRIEAAAGDALTVTADGVTLRIDGENALSGGAEASGLVHYNTDPLSMIGSGTLTVTGNGDPAVSGSISVDNAEVIARGSEGIDGDVTVSGGSVTATGTTHAGIAGDVNVYSAGSITATGGSGSTGITGDITLGSGTLSVSGGTADSGSTAPAVGGDVYAHNVFLEPSAETTAFTLHAEESGVRLSNVQGTAYISMYYDYFYESGGTLIVQDASGAERIVTVKDDEAQAALTIGSDGSITGETDNVTMTVIPAPSTVVVRYKVTTNAENGTIDIGTRYRGNETVTFAVTPDAGYTLKSLTITRKSGVEVAVTESNGIYTFKMPSGTVTVNAVFVLAFEDIEADHQFYDAIEWVYQQKLILGVTETTFDRVNPVTRQQVWRILARLINNEDPGSMAAAKEWAVANGIADGTEPGAAATREEFVTMLWIACGKPAADASVLAAYTDAAAISADASAAMAWAVSEGIVGGYADGTLRPEATATRGAFAAILYRYLTK